MKTKTAAILAGLAALLTAQTAVHAQYAYKTLAFPLPGIGQACYGIDGSNIVGTYSDASYIVHGFLYDGSNYATLDAPQAALTIEEGTWVTGISGTNIVGYYDVGGDTSETSHGFLYNGTIWTTLDDPLAGSGGSLLYPRGTFPEGISGGEIVGHYTDTNGVTNGFLYDGTAWTTLGYPGAMATSAQGISGSNIVGSFTDTNGVTHGFFYNGGVWTTLDAPMSTGTFAEGVSGSNIVGYYSDNAGLSHGFLYSGGNWTTLDDPLAASVPDHLGNGTFAQGISGSNIIGYFYTTNGAGFLGAPIAASMGFLYSAGSYQTLNDPLNSYPTSTVVTGIEGTNIVGYFIFTEYPDCDLCSPQPWRGFLYDGSAWTNFADPLGAQISPRDVEAGLATPLGTVATGVSGTNIVGYYFDTNYEAHGFVYSGGAWTTLDAPTGAQATFPGGISGSNIVGYFVDTNSAAHGFLYNGAAWTTLDYPGAARTSAQGISGANIVGYYVDTNGTNGFLYNGSSWTALNYPGAAGTTAQGIAGNNIVGSFTDTNGVSHGFLYNGTNWTILNDPGAGSATGMGTFAQGISGPNIVGYFVRSHVGRNPIAIGFLATPTPGLAIASSTNGLSLSWPYNPPATWVLQQNASLTSTNWTPAPGVGNDGTNNFITVTPSAQAMFFRLMLQ